MEERDVEEAEAVGESVGVLIVELAVVDGTDSTVDTLRRRGALPRRVAVLIVAVVVVDVDGGTVV